MIDKKATTNVKAIAIIMVMVGHLIGAKKIDVNIAWLDIATFGVSLFLFISGYGLYKSFESKGLSGYFSGKINKVYIPFALVTFLVGGSRGFWGERWPEMIKTVLFLNPSLPVDGTMWYIYYIAVWYAAFFLLFHIFKNDLIRLLMLSAISLLIFQIPYNEKYAVASFLFRFHSFPFTIGVAVAMCKPANRILMLLLGSLMFITFIYLFSFHFVKYDYMNHVFASMISAPAIIFIIAYLNFDFKPITFIGGLSYELYLFEGAFRWNSFAPNKLASCILFFLITLSCAYMFKCSFEKLSILFKTLSTKASMKLDLRDKESITPDSINIK
ncbi:acyltransferase family protein [Escherichia coli]|uniref:acyltransferase family protein n=1 Tax=Escherichia coli TaxID=562 RepID=UPI000750E824|nr:acyltransferase [Escherichia coli]EFD4401430.1 acyltransferase [Escherichia coli]EGL8737737.1 acyltransferase [Escherichia coli]EJA7565990.1 acyltransferase [Escherichia coli]EKS8780216.1 acyltransferase [Escherichia coli]ELM0617937.1 acyltransferase [Escherichia coli]